MDIANATLNDPFNYVSVQVSRTHGQNLLDELSG